MPTKKLRPKKNIFYLVREKSKGLTVEFGEEMHRQYCGKKNSYWINKSEIVCKDCILDLAEVVR